MSRNERDQTRSNTNSESTRDDCRQHHQSSKTYMTPTAPTLTLSLLPSAHTGPPDRRVDPSERQITGARPHQRAPTRRERHENEEEREGSLTVRGGGGVHLVFAEPPCSPSCQMTLRRFVFFLCAATRTRARTRVRGRLSTNSPTRSRRGAEARDFHALRVCGKALLVTRGASETYLSHAHICP